MACRRCNSGWVPMNVRVMGGTFEGAHESEWCCEECVDKVLNRVRKKFPDAVTIPKPGTK